ncbi:MAG: SUMF1/EgtB/PvdO family nonheme iron enzyme [Armatimonadetes bacterium]|nr:SUMF1/EgtB/PvdO family nonheme iron enzyme [Armatimonadota bacterium]
MIALTVWVMGLSSIGPEFVRVPAGEVRLGKKGNVANPLRTVRIGEFEIAAKETTNAQFAAFVKATGYVTDAERSHNAMVFEPGLPEFRWIKDKSADWRFPNGRSRDSVKGKDGHPVTSVSFHDASEYCRWAGFRLPTLDEWEAACRAGTSTDWFFGSDDERIREYANVWHGRDHLTADRSDGYMTTSPVGSFKPNPIGLYDMYGNVFEFCTGQLPGDGPRTVHSRGGSWWCSKRSCCFFNSADIGKVDRHASFSNQGFRVVRLTLTRR